MKEQVQLTRPIFKKLHEIASETGTEIYAVGGYVRDLFLDRPSKDIDILVIGDGPTFAQQASTKLKGASKVTIFQTFGTASINVQGLEVEFVGARKESYRSESRNPIVEPGSLQDDLSRRDFSINALAIQIYPEFNKLVDLFDGMTDLQNKRIVTPLEPIQTFSDDPLRMMRAIRFATQLNFRIDPITLQAIKENAERIDIISKERIADELNKIIASPKPSIGFKLLFDTGLLVRIFPEMAALQGIKEVNGIKHKDNFYHTIQVLDQLCLLTDDLWLRWSAILHDIAKPPTQRFEPEIGWTFHGHEEMGARMTPKIFRNLRLPLNEKMKFVQKLVRLHLRPMALTKEIVTDSAVRRLMFDAGEDIDALLKLCRADITSKNEEKVKKILKNLDILEAKIKEVEEKDRIRNWQPPITGELIMETFQIPACRQVGDIKLAVREAILDGIIPNSYDEAFQFMLEEGKKLGLTPALA